MKLTHMELYHIKRLNASIARYFQDARLTTAKAIMAATKEGRNYANRAWYAEVVAALL